MASKLVRAAVLSDGRFEIRELPLVVPTGGEELEVAACGICGSDLRYQAGEDAWAAHTLGEARRLPPEMVLGHEIAAWRQTPEGRKLVALIPFFTCGRCSDCRAGRSNLCRFTVHHGHGRLSSPECLMFPGFAERTSAYAFQMLDAPPRVGPDELTLLDGLAVAIHGLRHAGLRPGDTVCVLGLGPIGLSAGQAARYMGARAVAGLDVDANAVERARSMGIAALQGGAPGDAADLRRMAPEGFDVVLDTTGAAEAQRLGLDVLRRGGTAVMMAGLAGDEVVEPRDLSGEKRITGSCNCFRDDYELGLEMMAAGAFAAREMVTHVFALDDIEKGFEVAANKSQTGACKVVIRPNG